MDENVMEHLKNEILTRLSNSPDTKELEITAGIVRNATLGMSGNDIDSVFDKISKEPGFIKSQAKYDWLREIFERAVK